MPGVRRPLSLLGRTRDDDCIGSDREYDDGFALYTPRKYRASASSPAAPRTSAYSVLSTVVYIVVNTVGKYCIEYC